VLARRSRASTGLVALPDRSGRHCAARRPRRSGDKWRRSHAGRGSPGVAEAIRHGLRFSGLMAAPFCTRSHHEPPDPDRRETVQRHQIRSVPGVSMGSGIPTRPSRLQPGARTDFMWARQDALGAGGPTRPGPLLTRRAPAGHENTQPDTIRPPDSDGQTPGNGRNAAAMPGRHLFLALAIAHHGRASR
jgi:hypothetical protein